MPISIEQRVTLYKLARDHWLEAHCTTLAYEREFQSKKSVSIWMKRGTLAGAILTTLSVVATMPPLTIAAGAITSVLSGIEQTYSPAESSQKLWDCRVQLEGIKRDLVVCAIAIENAEDMASGMDPINQISGRITETTKLPIQILDADRLAARIAFNGSVLAGLINRYDHEPERDEAMPDVLGFDAPDIVAVGRQRIAA
tara:strand:- start:951 stop:1547 length:597 start_codon:yes stop_codon:yes gene_type:complete